MATETIATTAALTIVQPDGPPAAPSTTQNIATASQQIANRLQTILRRTPGSPGGPGGTGNPGGSGGPGGPNRPGGPPPVAGAPVGPAAVLPANHDD
jgi:hypothetical protein